MGPTRGRAHQEVPPTLSDQRPSRRPPRSREGALKAVPPLTRQRARLRQGGRAEEGRHADSSSTRPEPACVEPRSRRPKRRSWRTRPCRCLGASGYLAESGWDWQDRSNSSFPVLGDEGSPAVAKSPAPTCRVGGGLSAARIVLTHTGLRRYRSTPDGLALLHSVDNNDPARGAILARAKELT